MKELSIEEKAQRYDEAIEVISKCETDKYGCIIGIKSSDIFPELKESEDERIRKEIIDYFKADWIKEEGITRPDWIAWLEKRGGSYTKRDVDDAYLKGVTSAKNEIEKQYEATYQIRKAILWCIRTVELELGCKDVEGLDIAKLESWLEKQGEQNPA